MIRIGRVSERGGHLARIAPGPDRCARTIVCGVWCGVVALLLATNLATLGAAGSFRATVTWVDDGDTVWTLEGASRSRIRLDGIDCPELGQPFGLDAKQFVSSALLKKEVLVTVRDTDTYGRLVSRVSLAGRDMSEELVRAGLAWYYSRFSSDPVLAAAERDAQAAHRGLWSQPHPEAPWDYRARTRGAESTTSDAAVVRGVAARSAPVLQSSTDRVKVTKIPAGVARGFDFAKSTAAVKRSATSASKSKSATVRTAQSASKRVSDLQYVVVLRHKGIEDWGQKH